MTLRYRAPTPSIAHEIVDDEVIVINFATGDYYSCIGAAADAWLALVSGASTTETAALISSLYDTGRADVNADVESFLAALTTEGLLVPEPDSNAPLELSSGGLRSRGGYLPPTLDKYTDMADLVVLDPVHDVTAEGWPHVATNPPPEA